MTEKLGKFEMRKMRRTYIRAYLELGYRDIRFMSANIRMDEWLDFDQELKAYA